MKISIWNSPALMVLALGGPVRADIVYTNVNTGIATTYTGTTVGVDDGSLNLFFGGAGFANNSNFQPFRTGMGTVDGMNTVLNLSNNTFIDGSSGGLATGLGGSTDHLVSQFSTSSDGYVGFKLDNANYGWMRVRLACGTSGGVVRDWAYDNTGAAIKTGWINTDVVSATALTVTLNPATGESFTLSSTTPLVNASGTITNSVVKDGAGTTTLTGANTYSGTTAINGGKLLVNGNISTSVSLTVASGATLAGSGTVGATTVSGILAPGNSIGALTATGDVTWNANNAWVFELGLASVDLAAAGLGNDNDLLNIIGGGSDFLKGSGTSFTFDFANTGAVGYYKLVDWAGTTGFTGTDFLATNLTGGLTGTFTVDGGTSALYLNVVPEPRAALLGGLGLLALLRRRRVQ